MTPDRTSTITIPNESRDAERLKQAHETGRVVALRGIWIRVLGITRTDGTLEVTVTTSTRDTGEHDGTAA